MAEADLQTADPSVHGVRISDLTTGRIFAATSVYTTPECAGGRARTGNIWSHAE
jgi:hypothetical protein